MKPGDGSVTLPVHGPTREDTELANEWDHLSNEVRCDSDEEYSVCGDIARELAGKHKTLCGERDAIIKPINEGVARIRKMYDPVLKSLKAAESRVKSTMVTYQLDAKKKKDEAELAARQAIADGDHAAMVQHASAAVAPAPVASGTHVRKTWKIRVTDEKKVPREFLAVDMAALKRYAVEHKWTDAPDGVEFYQEEGIALR